MKHIDPLKLVAELQAEAQAKHDVANRVGDNYLGVAYLTQSNALALVSSAILRSIIDTDTPPTHPMNAPLTRREQFVASAMQGLAANGEITAMCVSAAKAKGLRDSTEALAAASCELADATLKWLDEHPEKEPAIKPLPKIDPITTTLAKIGDQNP